MTIKVILASLSTLWIKGPPSHTIPRIYDHQSYTCFSEYSVNKGPTPLTLYLIYDHQSYTCFSEYSVNKGPTLSHYTSYMTIKVILASLSTLWIKDPPLLHYTSYMTIKVILASLSTLWIKDPPSHTIPHIWPSKLYLLLWVLCE